MKHLILGIMIGLCIPYAWEASTSFIYPEPVKTNKEILADTILLNSLTESMKLIKYDYETGLYVCDNTK